MTRVLVVSHEYVRRAMAGPGIRNYELSRALARSGHEVVLAAPISTDLAGEGFSIQTYDPGNEGLRDESAWAQVTIVQGFVLEHRPWLKRPGGSLVIDLYDPFHLEYLAARELASEPERYPSWQHVLGTVDEQTRVGDFFLCASERQRDFWLGALAALGRVNPATYGQDRDLRRLIDVVPFGLPSEAPARRGPGMRAQVGGVGEGDFVVIWGGGVYDWFDPLSLIRGVGVAANRIPNLRLVFMSASHPNPDLPEQGMLRSARNLAAELGLEGRHVFFNETWVEYRDRADWLLDADLGVSMHFEHIEARFSFRTRMLDYFWAGLPIICTAGDSMAAEIERGGLGITVPPEDPGSIADALVAFAEDPERRLRTAARVRSHASELTWERAAAPLVKWCSEPAQAADFEGLAPGAAPPVPLLGDASRQRRLRETSGVRRQLSERALTKLRTEGPTGVARAVGRRLRVRRDA